jgi:phage-related tail protein
MTPEEKSQSMKIEQEADKRFPIKAHFSEGNIFISRLRTQFIEGANWMAEEKDKEIAELNDKLKWWAEQWNYTSNAFKDAGKEIAALKAEVEKLKEDVRLLNLPIVNFVKRQIKKQDDQIIP